VEDVKMDIKQTVVMQIRLIWLRIASSGQAVVKTAIKLLALQQAEDFMTI
jgi:hypothetical protein